MKNHRTNPSAVKRFNKPDKKVEIKAHNYFNKKYEVKL